MTVKDLKERLASWPDDMEIGLEFYSNRFKGYFVDTNMIIRERSVFPDNKIHFGVVEGEALRTVLTLD